MPAERVPMRCVRKIFASEVWVRNDRPDDRPQHRVGPQYGGRLPEPRYRSGAQLALPPTLTEAALEAMLFAHAGIAPGTRRNAEPDWPAIHRELRRRRVGSLSRTQHTPRFRPVPPHTSGQQRQPRSSRRRNRSPAHRSRRLACLMEPRSIHHSTTVRVQPGSASKPYDWPPFIGSISLASPFMRVLPPPRYAVRSACDSLTIVLALERGKGAAGRDGAPDGPHSNRR